MATRHRRSHKHWLLLVLIGLGLTGFLFKAWLNPTGPQGEPIEAQAVVTGLVSPDLFWAQPVGSEEPMLVYAPDAPWLKPGDTVQLEGERTESLALEGLTSKERLAAQGEPSVRAGAIEIVKPVGGEGSQALDVQEIRIDPEHYAGRDVTGTARVDQVHLDGKLLVLESNGDSIYALLNQPADVLGQELNVKGRVFAARSPFEPLRGRADMDIGDEGAFLYLEDYELVEQ